MKKITLVVLLFSSIQLISQNKITVGNNTSDYLNIISIYNTNEETVVVLRATPIYDTTGTLHSPLMDAPYVLSDQKGMRYALIKQSGWNGDGSNGFGTISLLAGSSKEFKVYFNKIEKLEDIYSLTELKCDGEGCWNFFDISVEESDEYLHPDDLEIEYDKTWIDYDVTNDDGEKGMRIHTKFTIRNMEGKLCFLKIRVIDAEDNFVDSTESLYIGDYLEVSRSLRPGYEDAVYSDLESFLPYNLIDLPSGHYFLKLDIDLTYQNEETMKHLELKSFTFTR